MENFVEVEPKITCFFSNTVILDQKRLKGSLLTSSGFWTLTMEGYHLLLLKLDLPLGMRSRLEQDY